MKLRPAFAPLALLAAIAAGAIVAAQPASPQGRQRMVGRWLVEEGPEEDGGRLVRMTRAGGGYRLEFHSAFWRGNYGRIQSVSIARRGCRNEAAIDPSEILHVNGIRSMLARGLAACGASHDDARAALRGLEPAYALALRWDWEASAATAAEAAAIANEGAENGMGADDPCGDAPVNMAADPDAMDMNATQAC